MRNPACVFLVVVCSQAAFAQDHKNIDEPEIEALRKAYMLTAVKEKSGVPARSEFGRMLAQRPRAIASVGLGTDESWYAFGGERQGESYKIEKGDAAAAARMRNDPFVIGLTKIGEESRRAAETADVGALLSSFDELARLAGTLPPKEREELLAAVGAEWAAVAKDPKIAQGVVKVEALPDALRKALDRYRAVEERKIRAIAAGGPGDSGVKFEAAYGADGAIRWEEFSRTPKGEETYQQIPSLRRFAVWDVASDGSPRRVLDVTQFDRGKVYEFYVSGDQRIVLKGSLTAAQLREIAGLRSAEQVLAKAKELEVPAFLSRPGVAQLGVAEAR